MKISVAMATYNGIEYVEEQLDSIRLQSLLPDEVVICDDASNDGTADFIEEYIEKHSLEGWRVYRNRENIGFKKNFLSAVLKTQGDIIFLCDQDDVWYKEKIEKMSCVMDKNKEILSLCSSFDFIDAKGRCFLPEGVKSTSNYGFIRGKLKKSDISHINLKTVMHSNISPGCTTVIKKELKDAFCMSSNSILPHDWELNLVAALKNGLYFYNQSLIGYRIHSSNTLGIDSAPKSRTEIASEKLCAAETLCRYTDFKANAVMQQRRLNALLNKSFVGVLKLFLTSREYAGYYSLKERVGDMLFTLGDK